MAHYKIVKKSYNGQLMALALILVFLIISGYWWFMHGEENYVKCNQYDMIITEYNYGQYGLKGEVYRAGDKESVSVKVFNNEVTFEPAKLHVHEGGRIKVWYSKRDGYTLFNPNTYEYDKKVYEGA